LVASVLDLIEQYWNVKTGPFVFSRLG